MYKYLIIISLLIVSVYADKKVEIFSKEVETVGPVMKANSDVVVLYDGLYVSADAGTFNRETGVLELFGNVNALQGAEYYAIGDYLMLNTKEDTRQFRPFYFQESKDEFWISSKSASSKKEDYEIHTGLVSSCNPQNPDWTIRFSTGYYDKESQWMQMYNARLYAGEVPVFYFPYFAYPTDTTRRTGLLRPTIGLSGDEGFMYAQSLYIAESPQWDLEITPQIRTKRGYGLYSTLRFVDSVSSKGSLTIGGFKEKKDYQKEFFLQNDKHYGVEFDYQHDNFLYNWFGWDAQGQSGIYADITYLNDVEYTNLKESDSLNYSTTNQVVSRVNVFLNQDENYYGIYGKYFIDLSKDSNAETMQNLPILHYHRALNTFFDNHLLYNVDYKGTSFYREEHKNAFQNEVTIPIGLQFPFMDEFFTLTVSENLYASQISFNGSESNFVPAASNGYSSGTYGRDFQLVEVNTNLVKAYKDFSHTMGFTVAYLHPGTDERSGFYKDYKKEFEKRKESNLPCRIGDPCEFDNTVDFLEQTSLEFQQFVFLNDGVEKLYHRIRQPLIHESGYETLGDLENELRYYFTENIYYYNNTFYNYDRNVIAKTQNSINYSDEDITFSLSHLYEDKLTEYVVNGRVIKNRVPSSYVTTDARYNYSHKWQYYGGYAYDIERAQSKNRYIGMLFSKRCWSVDLKYLENVRPTLDSSGRSASIRDKILYLTLNLTPLGGAEVNYKSSSNERAPRKAH